MTIKPLSDKLKALSVSLIVISILRVDPLGLLGGIYLLKKRRWALSIAVLASYIRIIVLLAFIGSKTLFVDGILIIYYIAIIWYCRSSKDDETLETPSIKINGWDKIPDKHLLKTYLPLATGALIVIVSVWLNYFSSIHHRPLYPLAGRILLMGQVQFEFLASYIFIYASLFSLLIWKYKHSLMIHGILLKIVVVGTSLHLLSIIIGAFHSNYAWGVFFSWDPYEAWSFILFIFCIYAMIIQRINKRDENSRGFYILKICMLVMFSFTFIFQLIRLDSQINLHP